MTRPKIGFIGQGWIGKNYADDFEARGYAVVRYALEEPYAGNKDAIGTCDIVFVAVPTPTTLEGFDDSIVRGVIPLAGVGKTVVVKSTLRPGTTEKLQETFPDRIILHSPEFLRETSAAYDAAHPVRNLIGIPLDDDAHQAAAEAVVAVLPEAPFVKIMSARAAELAKYAGNAFLTIKVVYANLLFDLAEAMGISYDELKEAIAADPRIGPSHLTVVSASGHSDVPGRGAGGHCLIKDFEGLRQLYRTSHNDPEGAALFDAVVAKNNSLLKASGKDLDLLQSVYGKDV